MKSSRWAQLLAVGFLGSGVLHFVKTSTYADIVPDFLPQADNLVRVSGVVELLCGFGLLRKYRWAALVSVGLLIAVFPANVQMAIDYQTDHSKPWWAKTLLWLRLPLQIPLVRIAWKAR